MAVGPRRLLAAWALVLAVGAGCKKQEAAPPPPEAPMPQIPATEIKRGEDACKAYVTQVCACTAPDAKAACELAKALPDAMRVGLEVSMSPDSNRRDVIQANDLVRKTIKSCIEHAAKLPSLGC